MAPQPATGGRAGPTGRGRRLSARQIIVIILAVLAVIFVAQNTQDVRVDFLWATLTMPLWFTFLILLLVGALIGAVLARRRSGSPRR